MNKPELDESKASEYIGKTILLGVTYLDHNEELIEQKQWHGVIETFSNSEGIRIKLANSDHPCCLPPDPSGIRQISQHIRMSHVLQYKNVNHSSGAFLSRVFAAI